MTFKIPPGRGLLRFAGILFIQLILLYPVAFGTSMLSLYDEGIKLNPDYQLKRMSNGEVVVTSRNPNENAVKHTFTDLYADLLLGLYRRQDVNFIIGSLAKKYYLSDDECRREIKHAVNVLSEWNIILRQDQMALR
jgi:hypothetical protein